jgi:hypothetical protein
VGWTSKQLIEAPVRLFLGILSLLTGKLLESNLLLPRNLLATPYTGGVNTNEAVSTEALQPQLEMMMNTPSTDKSEVGSWNLKISTQIFFNLECLMQKISSSLIQVRSNFRIWLLKPPHRSKRKLKQLFVRTQYKSCQIMNRLIDILSSSSNVLEKDDRMSPTNS